MIAGKGEEAMKVVRSVVVDFKNWTKGIDVLFATRKKLGEMLDALGE